MNIKIAIQDSYITDSYTSKLIEACEGLGLAYECFGMVPFVEDFSAIRGEISEDTESLIIPFGSTKIIKLWLNRALPKNWKVFYDKHGFDASFFSLKELSSATFLKDYLVNGNAFFENFPTCADYVNLQQDFFCKPTTDLKLFNAHIIPAGKSLRQTLEEQNTDSNIYEIEEKVLFSPVVGIVEEYRCFVVEDKVGTCQYRKDGKLEIARTTVPAMMMFSNLLHLYNPTLNGDPYVVDVALVVTNRGLKFKILEYNAFQCSGFYDCDVKYILTNLKTFLEQKYGNQ